MDLTASDIVAAARMAVHKRHPYLSHVLFALRPHPAPGLGTMTVDEGWRLYYDPATVTRWHEEAWQAKMENLSGTTSGIVHDGVAGVIFHELGHVLRKHHERRGDRDPQAWNRAVDREINDDVVEAGWKLPGVPLMPDDVGRAAGLLAEEYYQQQQPQGTKEYWRACAPGCGGQCGGASGNPTDWEKENSSSEPSRSGFTPGEESLAAAGDSSQNIPAPASGLEQQIVLRKTALDTIEHMKTKGRGRVPAGLIAWAQATLTPPKIDWRKKLAGLCRQALSACAGACDFTWKKSGRRSLHCAGRAGWPLAPALHQPVPKVAVVLDTSGSMLGGDGERTPLEEALSEVLGIVKASGGDCWGIACDADVEAIARLTSARDLAKINKGGGGTIMTPGFLAAKKLKPDVVVIVTDGLVGNGWPSREECARVRVLAAIVAGGPEAPEWIPSVEIS